MTDHTMPAPNAASVTTCDFCGHPAVGYSPSERAHVCQSCADGILPSDPYGMRAPYQPIPDVVPLEKDPLGRG